MKKRILTIAAASILALTALGAPIAGGLASAAPDKANLGKSCDHISTQGQAHSAVHAVCNED